MKIVKFGIEYSFPYIMDLCKKQVLFERKKKYQRNVQKLLLCELTQTFLIYPNRKVKDLRAKID